MIVLYKAVYKALASKVLAVASLTIDNNDNIFEWRCYIDAVHGQNHENEYMEVSRTGDKISEEIAIAIFPEFKDEDYAR